MLRSTLILSVILISACANYTPPHITGQTLAPTGCSANPFAPHACQAILEHTLRKVNASIRYTPDPGSGVDDWHLPAAGGQGDCEDFALRFRRELNAQGIYNTYLALFYTADGNYHINLFVGGWFLDYQERTLQSYEALWRDGYRLLRLGDERGNWHLAYDALQRQGLRNPSPHAIPTTPMRLFR